MICFSGSAVFRSNWMCVMKKALRTLNYYIEFAGDEISTPEIRLRSNCAGCYLMYRSSHLQMQKAATLATSETKNVVDAFICSPPFRCRNGNSNRHTIPYLTIIYNNGLTFNLTLI